MAKYSTLRYSKCSRNRKWQRIVPCGTPRERRLTLLRLFHYQTQCCRPCFINAISDCSKTKQNDSRPFGNKPCNDTAFLIVSILFLLLLKEIVICVFSFKTVIMNFGNENIYSLVSLILLLVLPIFYELISSHWKLKIFFNNSCL